MWEHHRRAIEKLSVYFQANDNVLAMIVGGSLAKGWGDVNSDIDFMLIVTDEELARREKTGDLVFHSFDFTDYEGGFSDGKYLNLAHLEEIATKGSEPARSAFLGAFIAFSEIDELQELIERIRTYPEQNRDANIKSFAAQVNVWNWFSHEAAKRDDRYLMVQAASRMTLFGSRLILAHNRIIYPFHKWLMRTLETAPLKPDNMMELTNRLLENPCIENTGAYRDAVIQYGDWETDPHDWSTQFLIDSERNWLGDFTPVDDR